MVDGQAERAVRGRKGEGMHTVTLFLFTLSYALSTSMVLQMEHLS